ncbi:MAG: RES family NAD+ phosphorylase [Acetobacteraceae bacterium]|nr:RES family NAD+ phosphorylase [Acetobacteraceae bacterium]
MEFPILRLAEPRVVRPVATARLRDPVLHLLLRDPGLGDLPRDRLEALAADLAEIEGATSARLTQEAARAALFPGGRPHANFVNAAFAYGRPREANRFSPAGLGAWYAALAVDTALAEVGFHLTRALREAGRFEAVVEWAELWASMAGEFVDLRGLDTAPSCLHPDPAIGYAAGCALAEAARAEGLNGVVYPSLRHPGGTCLVALWPHAVQSVAQGAIWRMTWRGASAPEVEQIG